METVTTTTTTTVVQTVKKVKKPKVEAVLTSSNPENDKPKGNESAIRSHRPDLLNVPDPKYQQEQEWTYTIPTTTAPIEPTSYIIKRDDEDALYLGLRVYTHKDAPAEVVGRLKVEPGKDGDKKDVGDKASDSDKSTVEERQSLSSLVDSLEGTCDCEECEGRMAHPDVD